MTRTIVLALSALALVACSPPAQQAETTPPPAPAAPQVAAMTDAQFAQEVVNATAFEVQSSELAPTNAARQDVKDFAAMMVREHRAAEAQLVALLPTLNIAAPTAALNADLTGDITELRGLRGQAFDDAYLDDQVEAHNNTVRLFESYIQTAAAGPLRDWATQTLATLRTHQLRAQALENAT